MTNNVTTLCPRCHGDAVDTADCWVCNGQGCVPADFTVLAPKPLAKIEAPLASWLGTLGDDPWLVEELGGQLNTQNPYRAAVLAGLTSRLYRPSRETALMLADEIKLTGRCEHQDRVWEWARSLTDEQVDTLAHLVATECGMLMHEMAEAGDETDICVRRDDLVAVVGIIFRSGRSKDLEDLLAMVDEAGRKLEIVVPDIERLWRPSIFDFPVDGGGHHWWLPDMG